MEQLWGFLHRFSKMTKEMHPSHCIDVLCDAILHYGRNYKDKSANCLRIYRKLFYQLCIQLQKQYSVSL